VGTVKELSGKREGKASEEANIANIQSLSRAFPWTKEEKKTRKKSPKLGALHAREKRVTKANTLSFS